MINKRIIFIFLLMIIAIGTLSAVCASDLEDNITSVGSETPISIDEDTPLESSKPILALSAYHRKEDLITLPQFVKSVYKNCRMYLRKHEGIDLYGLDLYVIPE